LTNYHNSFTVILNRLRSCDTLNAADIHILQGSVAKNVDVVRLIVSDGFIANFLMSVLWKIVNVIVSRAPTDKSVYCQYSQ